MSPEQKLERLKELADQAMSCPDFVKFHDSPSGDPYYRFLFLVAQEFRPKIMVELGVNFGEGSANLAAGNPDGIVIAVDARFENLKHEQIGKILNIEMIAGETLSAVGQVHQHGAPNLVFFDSDHEEQYVHQEFKAYDPICALGAIQIFDDLNYHGVRPVWEHDVDGLKFEHPGLHGEAGIGIRVKT